MAEQDTDQVSDQVSDQVTDQVIDQVEQRLQKHLQDAMLVIAQFRERMTKLAAIGEVAPDQLKDIFDILDSDPIVVAQTPQDGDKA